MTPATEMKGGHSPILEKILQLTLEMVYLLTGETPPPEFGGHVTIKVPPPHFLLSEKILEVTRKITQLLTGEVSIRSEDVAVYFSLEEREYLEGHKELYKDPMIEDPQLLPSPDKANTRNTLEKSPLYSQDSTQEGHMTPHHYQVKKLIMRVEVKDEMEDRDGSDSEQFTEEEISPDISTDFMDPKLDRHINIEDEERVIKFKVEEFPSETVTDGLLTLNTIEEDGTYMLHSEIKDKIAEYFPGGSPTAAYHHPAMHIAGPLTDPFKHGEGPSPWLVAHNTSSSHKKMLPCSICGTCFSEKSELAIHKRIHKGEKPYSCSVCKKCFPKQADLMRHERVHTGEKPYACSECGKCFTQKSYLHTHKRIHTGERPYSCPECGKCFARKSILMLHETVHTGEKPHSCSECGKCFTHKSNLITHARLHTGVKPYSCAKCGKSFTWKSGIMKHERIHAGKKRHSCFSCGICFTRKFDLILHEKIHTM